ncbi:Asp-tRNA(Asn)/Glu-tRNA(Gln) amidotransferase subunit GatB [Schwartzia succinivorans]|jgi:aspartyl-tRNA(Asn)/glutamyl-tRNA(Gln) amidotransferase subunit B|uniref:Aspartyl/glutamyl-tRNA(Asn/Gln) amidotransferase subunit B n=1 Tax=Schwartzia succinivorans DSM 10502 TaxID=1123243 RepID=A0A1M4V8M4_9FIRM|nr:Asp-tRNA(Asn)/Glu-tRNA(Gln) amidotransferase subunit GatB [Schwartzia succinivorans]MBQ1470208.1 Asp-tRNA(Asn)/Glu-tRNA(Gln) amidotransferase subunit GatB [Schwartzia sp. (in: firmicutes)]MBE6098140.1 Asp-tRNA(Asn)/Glu-tRNA(Gln) amidotransferase subunit GatB [Schwartzia succinivorans]MBQ1917953.1 Asp-tRNA(Asn)/Glu-tRNA(Gln) amidotransferase subunit GatB [Schwartzia sp. (in: firmicutes)]MBQ2048655.1 Asp-tRNA(Asn)/Glu-tRNA(Gln) amidotransferase subunit GatB [Schwartzia sp. (in: firmicutes)]MB
MKYEAVIGLEIHCELKTKTKIFCGCETGFGGDQNTHVCPVCLGLPGVLPTINKRVVEFGIKAGLATNCTINKFSKFDRKNYYYPDLPKNWQTSQYDLPIAEHGWVDIDVEGEKKRVRLTRIHMEEDAGKLVHSGNTIKDSASSNVDYNRTGVPLLEIVSEPDMHTAEEARTYMEKIKAIMEYIDVSNCRMEEGNLRADVNVSIRPVGSKELGTRTEMKNINSFKSLVDAIDYEIDRQTEVLEDGGHIVQETRTWDPNRGITLSMRSKEDAHDYRYMPEPDLPPIVTTDEQIEAYRKELPELPDARRERLEKEYGLSDYDAGVITASRPMAEYFDEVVAGGADAKLAANWIMGELAKHLNAENKTIVDSPVEPARLAAMIQMITKGTISSKIAKTVFEEMWTSKDAPEEIVKAKGLVQITDTKAIEEIVDKVIADNPKPVEDYKGGNKKAIGALVGQVMKQSKGKANPQMVNQLLAQKLG